MPIERLALRSAALAATLFASFPAFAADPLGVWMNDTGRGAIEIKDCGGKLCGHVVWVKDTSDTNGCGREIIHNAVSTGGGVWGGDDAWIYSPEKKKKYNVEITPLPDGTLKVKGYAGISFLSKTMIWTKAPANLERCGEQQAAAKPDAATPPPASADKGVTETQPAAPAPSAKAPADEPAVAKNDSEEEGGLDGGDFSDVFTMKDGKCKLDTPWVKLDIDCKKKDKE
jgi:uncharacterized protein (DUF2147 family)